MTYSQLDYLRTLTDEQLIARIKAALASIHRTDDQLFEVIWNQPDLATPGDCLVWDDIVAFKHVLGERGWTNGKLKEALKNA